MAEQGWLKLKCKRNLPFPHFNWSCEHQSNVKCLAVSHDQKKQQVSWEAKKLLVQFESVDQWANMSGPRHVVIHYKKTETPIIQFQVPTLMVGVFNIPISVINDSYTLVRYGNVDLRGMTYPQFQAEVSPRVKKGDFNTLHFLRSDAEATFFDPNSEVGPKTFSVQLFISIIHCD